MPRDCRPAWLLGADRRAKPVKKLPVAGDASNSTYMAMQAQSCPAVEFRPFRDEDWPWAGGLCMAITR